MRTTGLTALLMRHCNPKPWSNCPIGALLRFWRGPEGSAQCRTKNTASIGLSLVRTLGLPGSELARSIPPETLRPGDRMSFDTTARYRLHCHPFTSCFSKYSHPNSRSPRSRLAPTIRPSKNHKSSSCRSESEAARSRLRRLI